MKKKETSLPRSTSPLYGCGKPSQIPKTKRPIGKGPGKD